MRCLLESGVYFTFLFPNTTFIGGRRLLEGGIYKRAVFKRGNSVKYFTSVRSAGIILWWWWFEGGGEHEIFTNREAGPTIFLLLPGGIKNLTESFIPFLLHPPVS